MHPVPLDEFPIHQAPLSLRYVGTTDRNFYDRCYFNAHDRTGDLFFVTGLGVYPNLGVTDAYARCAAATGSGRPLLRRPRRTTACRPAWAGTASRCSSRCSASAWSATRADRGLGFDLTWEGSFPAVDGAAPRDAGRRGRRPGHPRRLPLRPGRHVGGHVSIDGDDLDRRPRRVGRHARPLVGHPPGRRGRARRPQRRRADRRASGGCTCPCASTTSPSS